MPTPAGAFNNELLEKKDSLNMSYFRKPNPKSSWKRPKPKIYDCNTRDLENFYTSSYNEYLNAKQDIRSRDLERDRRGDAETLTRRFEQRRASSLVYGEDDAPRQHRFIPSRQTSNDGSSSNEHSHLRSAMANSSTEESYVRDGRSSTSSSRNTSYNTSLNAPDSNQEMASIESRLERLRKLREELGLPGETAGSSSTNAASSSILSSTRMTTESSSLRQSSPPETRSRETGRFARSGSAARSDSRSRGSPTRSGLESSSYSSRSERTSARNGDADSTSSYSTKSRVSRTGDTNGLSSSAYDSGSSTTTTTRRRQRVERPSTDDPDMTYDDDALLADMRRKIPSSSEILEKIRNMDIE